ncbi:MAG: hypothetical protein QM599_00280 [Pseudoxanthomonas sp.]
MIESTPAPALAAFLRGVERRGAVFAELQCGDATTGDAALAAALRAFRKLAPAQPMAQWPQRFWTLLAASPPLRRDASGAQWPAPVQALAGIDPDWRASLLLRLAAGLDETDAAAAQGIDADAYRRALAAACPRDAEGRPDAAVWRALAEAIQRQLRDLPPQRLAHLAQLREDALAPPGPAPEIVRRTTQPSSSPAPRRRRWPWLLLLLALCAPAAWLAWQRGWLPDWLRDPLAAAWPTPISESASQSPELPPNGVFALVDAPTVATEELPPAEAPAAQLDPATLPSVDEGEAEAALVQAADFLAWFAAQAQAAAPDGGNAREPAANAENAVVSAPVLPAPASDDHAARLQAWRQLDENERAHLRTAAAQLAALPPSQQRALHARFDQLDVTAQRGWRLGPALGAQYAELHPLLAYVPPEQVVPLRVALKAFDTAQRTELAALTQRTPPQERDALRRELLSIPPPQRSAWLAQRARRL